MELTPGLSTQLTPIRTFQNWSTDFKAGGRIVLEIFQKLFADRRIIFVGQLQM